MMMLMMPKDVMVIVHANKESMSICAHCVSGSRNVHVVASVGLECRLFCFFVLRPLLTVTIAAVASGASLAYFLAALFLANQILEPGFLDAIWAPS